MGKYKIKAIYVVLAILAVGIVSCTSGQEVATPVPTADVAAESMTLSVTGSGSVTSVLVAIADDFEAANPGYTLEVLPGSGTGGGVRGVVDGTLDLVAMSRRPSDDEAEQGVEYVLMGTSFTAIITQPDLDVTELTGEQLTGILVGTITNWSEVGGPDLDIVVYVRDEAEGNTSDIRNTFIGEEPFVESAQVMTSQTDMQNVVSSVAGAIGYGTWATVVANDANVVRVTINGEDVDNPSETLVIALGIGYLTSHADEAQPFIDWLLSDDGRAALTAVGVTPADPE